MDAEFDDDHLADVARNPRATAGHGDAVDKGFRKLIQFIKAAKDERDFYAIKSLHFEKLKGNRKHQSSLKINKQWRLIVEIRMKGDEKRIGVVSIEDYH